MNLLKTLALYLVILCLAIMPLRAQEESEKTELQQVLTQNDYDKCAPAVVKLVSDEGRRIGAGVIVGNIKEGMGFILTSYSLVAGRDKVAVILKNYPDPLLGYVVDRWIDFDSDLAIVAIKNFPPAQATIVLDEAKSAQVGDTFTILGHTEDNDWMPVPVELAGSNERHFAFNAPEYSGIEGAPLLNKKGNMIGLTVSNIFETIKEDSVILAVKTSVIKPIINEWFKPIAFQKKWREKGAGIATWIWAVGGGVLGGTVATAIVVTGGGEGTPKGLPRPPDPPSSQ